MEIVKSRDQIEQSSADNPLQRVRYEITPETQKLIQRSFTLVEKLVTRREEYKLLLKQKLREAKTEFDLRHSMHLLSCEIQLQTLKTRYETWLSMIKIRCCAQVTAFAQSEYLKLVSILEYYKKQFNQMIDKSYKECEENRNSVTYKQNLKAIEKQVDAFYRMQGKCIKKFEEALEAKIGKELITGLPR